MKPNDTFTPEEQALINRLKDAPQTTLKPQAMDAIRAQLFLAMDKPALPFWRTNVGMTSIGVVTTVIVIVIILIGVMVSDGDPQSPTVAPTQTLATETVTPTAELTETPAPTGTATVEASPTAEVSSTPTDTSTATIEASPTPQPTATTSTTSGGAPIMVIEGPISAINLNTLTIFDMDIQVDPANPILTQLQIGDRVRIDGQTSVQGNVIIIVAVNITIIDVQIIVEPGGGLPANCKMTKNGRITCKDTQRTTRRTSRDD